MICCVVAAYFIFRYIIRLRRVAKYFGFESQEDEDRYGWYEYCELDEFKN
jgi:hypothetical protein